MRGREVGGDEFARDRRRRAACSGRERPRGAERAAGRPGGRGGRAGGAGSSATPPPTVPQPIKAMPSVSLIIRFPQVSSLSAGTPGAATRGIVRYDALIGTIPSEVCMEHTSHEFLRQLLETPSPSGFEQAIQQVVRDYAEGVRRRGDAPTRTATSSRRASRRAGPPMRRESCSRGTATRSASWSSTSTPRGSSTSSPSAGGTCRSCSAST